MKKLNNLLKFADYEKLSVNKEKTKRTEIGGDILKEHHNFTPEDQKLYIIEKLDFISDDLMETIYNLIESEIE